MKKNTKSHIDPKDLMAVERATTALIVILESRMRFLLIITLFVITLLGATTSVDVKPFKPKIQLSGDLTIDKMRAQNLNVVKKQSRV